MNTSFWEERDSPEVTTRIFVSKWEIPGKGQIHGRRKQQRKETQFCK